MLLKLADEIPTPSDLRKLAITGLGIKSNVLEVHLTNNPGDFATAVYQVLLKWSKKYCDRKQAYTILFKALQNVGMSSYTNALL